MGSETVMDLDTSVLCKAPTQKVLFAAMSRQLKSLGIHAVVIRDLCEMSRNRFQEVTAIYTTYPEHIRDKYREHNCLPIDPFLRTALSSLKPARLTEYLATNELEGPLASVLADLRKADLGECIAMRIAGARGSSAFVAAGLSDKQRPLSEFDLYRLRAYFTVVLNRYRTLTPRFSANLSSGEQTVLRVMATGASNKQIARDLDISPHTVNTIVDRIFAKLAVKSRTEAVIQATRSGVSVVA